MGNQHPLEVKPHKNPRERVKEVSVPFPIKTVAYDARPHPINGMKGAGTYVEHPHAIIDKKGNEIGWYGWSSDKD